MQNYPQYNCAFTTKKFKSLDFTFIDLCQVVHPNREYQIDPLSPSKKSPDKLTNASPNISGKRVRGNVFVLGIEQFEINCLGHGSVTCITRV